MMAPQTEQLGASPMSISSFSASAAWWWPVTVPPGAVPRAP
jgi:hypothetical protein